MFDATVKLIAVSDCVNGELRGDGAVEVSDVAHDSREVRRDSLFTAIRGLRADGHAHVEEAAHRGAAAALVEEFRTRADIADKGARHASGARPGGGARARRPVAGSGCDRCHRYERKDHGPPR